MRRRIAGITLIAAASAMAGLLLPSVGATTVETTTGTGSISPSGAGASRAMAAPEPKTVTVPATRIIDTQRSPSAPADRCSIVVLFEFAHVPKMTSALLTFTTNGTEQTRSAPPYSDTYELQGVPRTAPAGYHWIQVAFGSVAGANAGNRCDDETKPAIEASTSASGTVEVSTTAKLEPKLKIKMKQKKSKGSTRLQVSVTNTGTVPVDSVRVRPPKIKTLKRAKCKGDVVRVASPPGVVAVPGALEPNETKRTTEDFVLEHLCAGAADVTVSAEGDASGAPVKASKATRLTVPGTAFIEGEVTPATPMVVDDPVWGDPDVRRYSDMLLSGLRIEAKGKRGTFTGRVKFVDGADGRRARYRIEIPSRASDLVHILRPISPKGTKVGPARVGVDVDPGETLVRNFKAEYDCKVPPPGLGFAPRDGQYFGSEGPVITLFAEYDCGTRLLRIGGSVERSPNFNSDQGTIHCRQEAEPHAEYDLNHFFFRSPPLILEPGGRFSSLEYLFVDQLAFEGRFLKADLIEASMVNRACAVDVSSQNVTHADSR
jgi:hypothetical protein